MLKTKKAVYLSIDKSIHMNIAFVDTRSSHTNANIETQYMILAFLSAFLKSCLFCILEGKQQVCLNIFLVYV